MNERTYRQLHPRVIDAPRPYARIRATLFICALVAGSALFWLLVLGVIFWPNTPCAVCGR